VEAHENRLHEGAEGLTYCNLIQQEDADHFQLEARDRNAEFYNY
jgi:hypothetical protein